MVAPGGDMHGCSLGGGDMRGCSLGEGGGGMHGCSQGGCMVAWGACVVAPGGLCVVAPGGTCMVAPWGRGHACCSLGEGGGGMHGCSRGGAWLLGGHVWLLQGGCVWLLRGGTCMVAPWGRGHAWLLPGGGGWGHAWLLPGGCMVAWGACVVAPGGLCVVAPGRGMRGCSQGGMRGCSGGGCAWDTTRYGDTVNERAVRILLECILVKL